MDPFVEAQKPQKANSKPVFLVEKLISDVHSGSLHALPMPWLRTNEGEGMMLNKHCVFFFRSSCDPIVEVDCQTDLTKSKKLG